MMDPSHKSQDALRKDSQDIPSELIGRILEELVESAGPDTLRLTEDAEAHLKQCALVDRTFHLYSQQHLFRHMDLDNEKHVSCAAGVLQASDRLCDAIRSITLDCFAAASNVGILTGKSVDRFF